MGSVRKDVQLAVDQYLDLYEEYQGIRDKLETLRQVIETYMKENELTTITGSHGKARVDLGRQSRAQQSARFTTYDLNEISSLLSPSQRKKCVVEVVDKEKLEALCKLGDVSAAVLERKLTKDITTFTVRLQS